VRWVMRRISNPRSVSCKAISHRAKIRHNTGTQASHPSHFQNLLFMSALQPNLQHLLGYAKWDNFLNAVSKAKTACEVSGHQASDHFAGVGKTITMPKGASKEIQEIMLTRYACYLIAQNGDPQKQEIDFAQTYSPSRPAVRS
jgi:hypothetical protein